VPSLMGAGFSWSRRRSVVHQGPGLYLDQVAGGKQCGYLDGGAGRRPGGIYDGVAGGAHRWQVRDVQKVEPELDHVAESGVGLRQAAAQVLEYLPRLCRRIPEAGQVAVLILRDLAAAGGLAR
jgi:hypothetical protein